MLGFFYLFEEVYEFVVATFKYFYFIVVGGMNATFV